MNETDYEQGAFTRRCVALTELGLFIFIIITLLLKLHLIFLLNIDIDEFRFLSTVHQYHRGSLTSPLFTFHVHLFSWLPLVAENEVIQVFGARTLMYVLGLGSCTFIYLTGRLFFNRSGALFSVLCYLSISNVIIHGTSFRYDPICVFLFLGSIYFLLRTPRSKFGLVAAGFSIALSMMVSLKTLFYLPTIGAVLLFQIYLAKHRKIIFKEILLFFMALLVGFILLYHFHLSAPSGTALPSKELHSKGLHTAANIVRDIGSRSIISTELFPNSVYILVILLENLIVWFFWLIGVILLVWDLIFRKNRALPKNLLVLSLVIPILVLAWYEFAFPYFYVFIVSPAIICSAVFVDKITEHFKKTSFVLVPFFMLIASICVLTNFFSHYKTHAFNQTVAQREIVQLVHRIFPEPIPYIDRCGMISSYPKVGLQMTTWDMEKYTEANVPIMRKILIRHRPVFIVANSVHLDLSLPRGGKDIFRNYPLLEEDYNILKQNFVHHWGKLYVAGKHFEFDSNVTSQTFEILIPGTYTLETDGEVSFNGVVYGPGSKIKLKKTTYEIVPKTNPMDVVLRWGEDLYKPSHEPSTQPIFLGYYLQALKMGY